MKKTIVLLFLSLFVEFGAMAQEDTLPQTKARLLPAFQLGANYSGLITGEAGFFLGITRKNLYKASHSFSTMCHGPSVGFEGGSAGGSFIAAPKISYEYYSIFYGTRLSVCDYISGNSHNLYLCPEAGISFGTSLCLFAGANIPLAGRLAEINTLRLSLRLNLYAYYFSK